MEHSGELRPAGFWGPVLPGSPLHTVDATATVLTLPAARGRTHHQKALQQLTGALSLLLGLGEAALSAVLPLSHLLPAGL